MSFRKLLLEFSMTKEILLIFYQSWVRSYLKHSGRLIKHGFPEVIALLFLQPCLLGVFSGVHKVWRAPEESLTTWGWFAVISERNGKGRETFFSVTLLFGLHISLPRNVPGSGTPLPPAPSPTHYIFNHFSLPLCLFLPPSNFFLAPASSLDSGRIKFTRSLSQ